MKKLMILIALAFFALAYLLGAIYWYFVGSFGMGVFAGFVISVAVFGGFVVICSIFKRYFLAAGFVGVLAAMFTATYWFIDLKLWLGF